MFHEKNFYLQMNEDIQPFLQPNADMNGLLSSAPVIHHTEVHGHSSIDLTVGKDQVTDLISVVGCFVMGKTSIQNRLLVFIRHWNQDTTLCHAINFSKFWFAFFCCCLQRQYRRSYYFYIDCRYTQNINQQGVTMYVNLTVNYGFSNKTLWLWWHFS